MSDKTDEPGKQSVPPAGPAAKKPAPIIDATATVVPPAKAPPTPVTAAPAGGSGVAAGSPKPSDAPKPDAAKSTGPASGPPPKAMTPGPVAPRRAGGGFVSHMAAGIVGAGLAVVGAPHLARELGVDFAPPSPEVARRLAALEHSTQRPPATSAETAGRFTAADARIAKLETEAQALTARLAAGTKALEDKIAATGSGTAAQQLARLEAQLADLVAAAGDPRAGRVPQLAELTAKVRELETAYVQRSAQLKTELVQLLDQRFAQTGEQAETARSMLAQRAQTMEQGLKSATEEIAALRTGLDTLKTDLEARFRLAAKPADVQTAVGAVASKLANLDASVQAITKSEQERNATAGNILLSLELANLKRALDRGGRYTAELAAVQKLAAGRLDFSALEAGKDAGIPSLATLGTELGALAHVMLDADAQPTEATVGERFLSGFKSIVRVRRTDHPPGDTSTEAVIARTETALREGRLADALAETAKLPERVIKPAPVTAWLKRLGDRAAIDKALAELDTTLKSSLAGGGVPKAGTTRP